MKTADESSLTIGGCTLDTGGKLNLNSLWKCLFWGKEAPHPSAIFTQSSRNPNYPPLFEVYWLR